MYFFNCISNYFCNSQEDDPDEEEAVNDNGGPVEADRAVPAGEVQEQDSNSTAVKDNYSVQVSLN